MTWALRADEHVQRVFVLALRATGYDVEWVDGAYSPGTADVEHLERFEDAGLVVVSNDVDFVTLHDDYDHAGVILYADQLLPVPAFVRGVRRIERYVPAETLRGNLAWLDGWVS